MSSLYNLRDALKFYRQADVIGDFDWNNENICALSFTCYISTVLQSRRLVWRLNVLEIPFNWLGYKLQSMQVGLFPRKDGLETHGYVSSELFQY